MRSNDFHLTPDARLKLYYYPVRDKIKHGDVLTWDGDGIIPKLIKIWSKGRSHACLVLRQIQEGVPRHVIMEAVGDGVQPRLLSSRLKESHGKVYWHQLDRRLDQFRDCITAFCWDCEGTEYDFGSLFKNMLGYVNNNMRRFFCSELVSTGMRSCISDSMLASFEQTPEIKMLREHVAWRPGDIPKAPIFLPEMRIY